MYAQKKLYIHNIFFIFKEVLKMQTLFPPHPNIFELASRENLEINDDLVEGTFDAFWRASISVRENI